MRCPHLVPALLLLVPVTACSSYPQRNGQLALARDGDDVVALVHPCSGGVVDLEVSADRRGLRPDQQNPSLGALRAAPPVTTPVRVRLTAPGPGWQVVTPVRLPGDPASGIVISARDAAAGTEVEGASALVSQLTTLRPGEVLVHGSDPAGSSVAAPEARFHELACR